MYNGENVLELAGDTSRKSLAFDLEKSVENVLKIISIEPSQEVAANTPKRAARALLSLTEGYEKNLSDVVHGAIFPCSRPGMVVVKDIELFSLCEHHMMPFFGKVTIGYMPNKNVLGLSKFVRIVEMYSQRLQDQEKLTKEIATAVNDVIEPHGVGVVMETQHMCMMMRGVKTSASTTTSFMLGTYETDSRAREEFWMSARK